MNDDHAFLRAIADAPYDDAPRLVYADWLDERGDPRGEYLRLDYQLAQARGRLEQLQTQLDPAWLTAVRRRGRSVGVVRVGDGRDASVDSIHQWFTYGGLLEGLPTDQMNRRTIDGLLREERGRGGEPYLVQAPVRPIPQRDDRPYPFGNPEALPAVTCVARLSSSPARDQTMDASELTVIWFQEDFAFPIDPAVLAHLRDLDWRERAIDTYC
jgi:uncharacterized protein (TIGR02996 family)